MYAIVAWDRAAGQLFAWRDWYGEKPLYRATHTADDGAIHVLASDARTVAAVMQAAVPSLRWASPSDWLGRYLQVGYGWEGETPYVSEDGTVRVEAVPCGMPSSLRTMPEYRTWRVSADPTAFETEVERLLRAAVQERLEADVPLGCFLSGGVDSSLIASYAREARPDLQTFCVRMPDERYDESTHAEQAARHLGTRHTTLDVDADPMRDLEHLIDALGQPFADSSILPTYWVSRAARQHVSVALSGDGGDELFYGYERHFAAPHLAHRAGLWRWLPSRLGARAHPKSRRHKAGRLGAMARDWSRAGLIAMTSIFHLDDVARLTGRRFSPARMPVEGDPIEAMRRADLLHYLPGDLLTKSDTAAMAVALEVRSPFLDRSLGQLVIPAATQLITREDGARGSCATSPVATCRTALVDRPKMGFAIPIGEWFRTDHGGFRTRLLEDVVHVLPCDSAVWTLIRGALFSRLLRPHI